jgi:hypothetical protein
MECAHVDRVTIEFYSLQSGIFPNLEFPNTVMIDDQKYSGKKNKSTMIG